MFALYPVVCTKCESIFLDVEKRRVLADVKVLRHANPKEVLKARHKLADVIVRLARPACLGKRLNVL